MSYSNDNVSKLSNYYRWHARVYDATRWAFLFGRNQLIDTLAGHGSPESVLEIGCGTGKTLVQCRRRFPEAWLFGVDLSASMLQFAAQKDHLTDDRTKLIEGYFTHDTMMGQQVDVIIASYCLSMINPGYQQVIEQAWEDLKPGGIIAVLDFHSSAVRWFERWMGVNHVAMRGHLLPLLEEHFEPLVREVEQVYLGLWRYFTFIGRKRDK